MSEATAPERDPTQMTFEQKLGAVKTIIDGIEGGRLPLEDAVRQYEHGMELLGTLEKELDEMKRRITVLQGDTEEAVPEARLILRDGE